MSIWLAFILFFIGIALVVKGGDIFVDAASWIARASGIPSFIVGATIVSLATTLPEMIVSVLAAAQGKAEMAVGNAVGSVTANTGLIMAVAMMFMTIICLRREYIFQSVTLMLSAAVLWLGCLTGVLSIWASVLLFVIFLVFAVFNVRQAREKMHGSEHMTVSRRELLRNLAKFVLGAAGIVLGSQLLVNSGSTIAAYFHVSERVIAVTMVAIGTSLPELVTTITAIAKKESGLSIGNLLGANIIDLCLILPICSLVSGQRLPVSSGSISLDMPVCLGLIVVALVPMLIRQKASRIQGVLILAAYLVYLLIVI